MASAGVEENRSGGDSTNGGKADQAVFERRHGELVEEAGALAAESGAGVTVVAVSPRSGEPRMSVFPAGGGGGSPEKKKMVREIRRKQEEIAGMKAAEVLAFEERLRALRLRVLQRIREEEAAAAAAGAASKDQAPPKQR